MRRPVHRKAIWALVIIILGLTVLIMSRTPGKTAVGGGMSKFLSLDFSVPESKEEMNMPYYSNNFPRKQDEGDAEFINQKNQNKEAQVVDYPFEDEVKENDFDPLSSPGEDDGKISAAKVNPLKKPGQENRRLEDVTCNVNNGKVVIGCKKVNEEVYVPFSFLRKYYEVFGKMSDTKTDTFLWSHTPPIKIYRQKKPYDPKGVFAFFDNYNVEVRDRVKCISGSTGVPISTQWEPNGYFYPIQIAQFGLSHYSKYIREKPPARIILENGNDVKGKWAVRNTAPVRAVPDPEDSSNQVVAIKATNAGTTENEPLDSPTLSLEKFQHHLLVLSFDIRSTDSKKVHSLTTGSKFNVTLTVKANFEAQEFFLHYVTDDFHIKVKDNHIFHGLGSQSHGRWQHVIRDIAVDIQKGAALKAGSKKKSQKIPRSKIILVSLSVSSVNSFDIPVLLDNLTLSSTEHLSQFFQAADWFVENQNSHGGWPIPVTRKFHQASNFYPTLRSGWHSAMGSGHGLSLLSRAWELTRDSKYSAACAKAVQSIFDNPGTENLGVRAFFLDEYIWYEEYPTSPSSFVLNGFMYALLGLYDAQALGVPGATDKSRQLYNEGLRSLIKMLPLYDTGSGTFYDLRHFTVPGISPNLARLDYHVTHINQLLIFASIHEDEPLFETTAARWIQYTEGERAPHN